MNRKIGNTAQICSAIRTQITDGRANGARLIHVANGKLNFILSESNALDMLRLWHEGMNVGFVSKNGLITSRDADDFMHDFPAGMFYTCGFDAIGGFEGHRPHGSLHTMPAQITEIKADEEGVRIVGVIKSTRLFGENLVLTRTIETKAGSEEVNVTDRLENRAFRDEKWMMLYHVNVGYPLVDAGAVVKGRILKSLPRNEFAAKCMKTMLQVEEPVDNMAENCFYHQTADGVLMLENRKLGRRFTVKSSFKKFVEWKSRASGDYVIGLEPGSCWLDDYRKFNVLKPGKSVVNRLTLKCERI